MLRVDVRKQLGEFSLQAAFESEGRVTGLFGASGAGKTSLVNMIAGLLTPDGGTIALDGEVLDRRQHQVVLGREVVELGPPADAGPLGDQRGRRTAPAVLDQALDAGLEQALPHGAGALLLRHAHGGRHGGHSARQQTNSQD